MLNLLFRFILHFLSLAERLVFGGGFRFHGHGIAVFCIRGSIPCNFRFGV